MSLNVKSLKLPKKSAIIDNVPSNSPPMVSAVGMYLWSSSSIDGFSSFFTSTILCSLRNVASYWKYHFLVYLFYISKLLVTLWICISITYLRYSSTYILSTFAIQFVPPMGVTHTESGYEYRVKNSTNRIIWHTIFGRR